MRVLVTGASGFVGRAVVREFREAGIEVRAATRQAGLVPPFGPGVEVLRGFVFDDAAVLDAALDGADGVVHLAAATRVRESHTRPAEYFAANVGATAELLRALDRTCDRRGAPMPVVFASTGAVYGAAARQPITEATPLAPTSPYAASKAAAEAAVDWQARTGRLAAITLRCFNVAGAVDGHGDADPTRLVPATLRAAAGRAPALRVNGNGTAVRDYVHVADVAAAYRLALAACAPGEHAVFNVGATPASVADVIAAATRVTGRDIPAERLPPAAEPPSLLADTSRIRRDLGWKPARSELDDIVRDAWNALTGQQLSSGAARRSVRKEGGTDARY